MNKTRKLIATAMIGGAISAGAFLGAGSAMAGPPGAAPPGPGTGLSDRPCAQSYYYCGGHQSYYPVLQGPGIPR